MAASASPPAWPRVPRPARGRRRDAGFGDGQAPPAPPADAPEPGAIAPFWLAPGLKPVGHGKAKHMVDHQDDVTAADIRLAAREGFRSVEHVKRYTTVGMGTDQGKTANVNGLAILADALGKSVPEVGTTTYRPPYTPVTFGALAGPRPRRADGPGAAHRDARVARGGGRRVRARGPVAPALVVSAQGRGQARGGGARVPRGARGGGRARRVDPRQDRHPGGRTRPPCSTASTPTPSRR